MFGDFMGTADDESDDDDEEAADGGTSLNYIFYHITGAPCIFFKTPVFYAASLGPDLVCAAKE
jgi:hypothetical protein